jgi:hypothetical protein
MQDGTTSAAAADAVTHASLSTAELTAICSITAFALFLVYAFLAYSIKRRGNDPVPDASLWTVAAQIAFSILTVAVVTLLMFDGIVSSEAGLAVLAGVTGVIVGKARTLGGGGNGGGAGQQGGQPPAGGGATPQQVVE